MKPTVSRRYCNLLKLPIYVPVVWREVDSVHVTRHLGDKGWSNMCDWVIREGMAQLSGKWPRERETSRFGIFHKRRGVAVRESEHQRAREKKNLRVRKMCCLRACVVNGDCAIAIFSLPIDEHRNWGLLRDCVEILGHFYRCHCTHRIASLKVIFRNLRGQLGSTGQWN